MKQMNDNSIIICGCFANRHGMAQVCGWQAQESQTGRVSVICNGNSPSEWKETEEELLTELVCFRRAMACLLLTFPLLPPPVTDADTVVAPPIPTPSPPGRLTPTTPRATVLPLPMTPLLPTPPLAPPPPMMVAAPWLIPNSLWSDRLIGNFRSVIYCCIFSHSIPGSRSNSKVEDIKPRSDIKQRPPDEQPQTHQRTNTWREIRINTLPYAEQQTRNACFGR